MQQPTPADYDRARAYHDTYARRMKRHHSEQPRFDDLDRGEQDIIAVTLKEVCGSARPTKGRAR